MVRSLAKGKHKARAFIRGHIWEAHYFLLEPSTRNCSTSTKNAKAMEP